MYSIIGGGPAGSYTAYLLAKEGYKVDLFEEHKEIGRPIQCTGIMTFYIDNILKGINLSHEDFLTNTITKTKVFAPDNSSVEISLKKNYIVDRALFDKYLTDLALSAGAKIHLGKRFTEGRTAGNKIKFKVNNDIITTDRLIGADGPFSQVAKSFSMYGKRKFALGAQARMKMENKIDPEVVEFFLGEGYFGWLVPEDEKTARVGIASNDRAKYYFDKLIKLRPGKIVEWQSGPIPVYNPRLETEKNNVMLIGDAATQVKATTYGGIIPSLIAAEQLAKAEKENKSYHSLWKKKIGKELWLHLAMRKTLDRFSDKSCNRLIKLTNQSRITKILTEHDREFPSKILARMLVSEPRYLSFFPSMLASLK